VQKKLQQEHHRNIFNLPIPLLQLKKMAAAMAKHNYEKKLPPPNHFPTSPSEKKI